MGTEVQNLPRYYSMRDLNEESSRCRWPLFYGDKTLTNGQHYHNHLSSTPADECSAYDKDILKQKILEHEATFKNQVFELHHLYRIQMDLMGEFNMKELHRNKIAIEASFATGPLVSQITSVDGKMWYCPGFPIGSSTCARPSISGIDGSHSPLDPSKGISKQASMFPSPNESNSKDVELLESKPSKVRRKMFDLHLPADEYIDTEESEKLSDEKRNGTTIVLPYRNCNHDVNLFHSNDGKTGSQEDSSRADQSLRSRNGLSDLNEAVEVEEINNASLSPTLNHYPYQGETECSDLSAKQKSRFFGLPRDDFLNLDPGTDSSARNNGYLESGSGKGLILSGLEAGKAKSKLKPIPQVFKQEQSLLSCHKMQDALSRAHQPTSDYPTNQSKADLLWEKIVSNSDISGRNHEYTTSMNAESVVSSHRLGIFASGPSPDLAKSWSHSASSLEMTTTGLNQKLASAQTPPWLNVSGALSRSAQSHQNKGILVDIWPQHINSKSHLGFRCEVPMQNEFYPGSSSGCKELSADISSISYEYLNHNNDDDHKRIPEHCSNGSAKYYGSLNSNCNKKQSGKVINFNVLLSNGSSNMLVTQSGLEIMDGEQKHEEQLASLPWLIAKTAGKNEVQNASRGLTTVDLSFSHVTSLSSKDETGLGSSGKVMHNVTSGFCFNDIVPRRAKVSESSGIKKILGVPIFDRPHISVKESFSLTSPSVSVPKPSDVELVGETQKTLVFDINLPCGDVVLELDKRAVPEIIVSKKGSPTKEAKFRNQIDLNLSMSVDEEIVVTIPTSSVKMKADIDLEAPAVPEKERGAFPEEKQIEAQYPVEQPQDELMRHAAETIVVMSSLCCNQVDDVSDSPSGSPVRDRLNWFVDVVSSCADYWERKFDNSRERDGEDNEESYSHGLDYFEAMTLKLPETKEEEYMPKPLVPENFRVEETGISLPTRTRKGPVRRGRQWKDFQRDILPGLTSLSRHEVTEDLQAFDGLMKATGHSWHSGLTRRSYSRNGCGRGRRRLQVTRSPPPLMATIEINTPLVQQLNNIEVGLEDRSLTGWGETPRRPRWQRCRAGNPPLIQLIKPHARGKNI